MQQLYAINVFLWSGGVFWNIMLWFLCRGCVIAWLKSPKLNPLLYMPISCRKGKMTNAQNAMPTWNTKMTFAWFFDIRTVKSTFFHLQLVAFPMMLSFVWISILNIWKLPCPNQLEKMAIHPEVLLPYSTVNHLEFLSTIRQTKHWLVQPKCLRATYIFFSIVNKFSCIDYIATTTLCCRHVFPALDNLRAYISEYVHKPQNFLKYKIKKACLKKGVLMGYNFKSITLQWLLTVTVEPSGALGSNLCIWIGPTLYAHSERSSVPASRKIHFNRMSWPPAKFWGNSSHCYFVYIMSQWFR